MAYTIYPIINKNYFVTDLVRKEKCITGSKLIIGTNSFKVSAQSNPNMSVVVATGNAFHNGYLFYNDANVNVAIGSNTSNYPRKDAIVISFNGANSTIVAIKGTPSSNPTCPSIGSNYIKLAEVYVGAGVTSIQASNVTDTRNTAQHTITSLAGELFAAEDRIKALEDYPRITRYKYGANPSYEVWSTGKKKIWGQGIINQASGNYDYTIKFFNDCGLYFTDANSCIIQVMYNSNSANNTRVLTARLASDGKSLRIVIPALGAYTGVYRWCVEGI